MHESVRELLQLDTSALSDALDRLHVQGVVDGLRSLAGPERIQGRVITVELGPSGAPSTRHLATAAVESALPGDVILIAHQGRSDCAGWGGNLSRAARARGLAGTFVDGAARDIDEARQLDYALYARNATPRTVRGRAVELSWGEPITFGGLRVATGDYVVADGSGIVIVPANNLAEVVHTATEIMVAEAEFARAIDGGASISLVMGARYEQMTRPIDR